MKKPRKYKVFRHFPYIYGVFPCKQVAGIEPDKKPLFTV